MPRLARLSPAAKALSERPKLREIPVTLPEYAFADNESNPFIHLAGEDYDPPDISKRKGSVSLFRCIEQRRADS